VPEPAGGVGQSLVARIDRQGLRAWDDSADDGPCDQLQIALSRFYRQHRDAFVTSYAVSNPAEDIAESFAAFAVAPSPSGSRLADRKRRFFERFPELVELREEIPPNPRILR
jgi:hypothetical protein